MPEAFFIWRKTTINVFRYVGIVDSVCPYCGKSYPRIGKNNYIVELVDSGQSKICTFIALRDLNKDISFHDAKNI